MKQTLLLLIFLALANAGQAAEPSATVGMEGTCFVSYDGPALEVKPLDDKSPVQVRMSKAAGGFDLHFIGLLPGKYDLRSHLLRKDGQAVQGIAPIPVQVRGLLPA